MNEKEQKWFDEVVAELRKVGVKGEIKYAGSERGYANAISPQAGGNNLFLVCGELAESGTQAQGVLFGGKGCSEITPVNGGFRITVSQGDLERQVDGYMANRYGSWCVSPKVQYVNRQGEEMPAPVEL